MNKLLPLLALLYLPCANAAEFLGADIGIYGGIQRVTDDTDSVQLGLTLDWTYVAVDLSTGIKRVAWRVKSEPQWKCYSSRAHTYHRQRYAPPRPSHRPHALTNKSAQ